MCQVLERAREIDKQKEDGNDTGPLCGLAMVVKDNIDVEGYITAAGTPALKSKPLALAKFSSRKDKTSESINLKWYEVTEKGYNQDIAFS